MQNYTFWTKGLMARQPLGGIDAVAPKLRASGDSV